MREELIREILRDVCRKLDRRAREVAIPAAAGVAMALAASGCENSTSTPLYMAPADTGSEVATDGGSNVDPDTGPPVVIYSVPWDAASDAGADGARADGDATAPADTGDADADALPYLDGAVAKYMAPSDSGRIDVGPVPEYMAPVDSGRVDPGPVPAYMAPRPLDGAVMRYMAPSGNGN